MPTGKPYEYALQSISLEAGADLSAKQFHFVTLEADGRVTFADTAGENCIGVLQNKPKTGEAGAVAYGGVSFVEAAATITPGQRVTTNNAGKAIVAATGNIVLGTAITPGSNGAQMGVLLNVGGGRIV